MEIQGSSYRQECPVNFGVGAIGQIAEESKKFGASKVLCIFDAGVEASGISGKVIDILKTGGLTVVSYDAVKPDPIDADIDKIAEFARDQGIDLVIGIGGGSPMDSAKVVSVLLVNPGKTSDYFLTKGVIVGKHAPVILVPTASGTGSEVTRVAVISDSNHAKDGVMVSASLAIVDPQLTVTAPPHVTAASGFDAMAHALESYTAAAGDPLSEIEAFEAMRLVSKYLVRAYENGADLKARTEMSKASNFAGLAFNNTGVHFGHAAGHEFGSVFHLPHGLACSYSLPVVAEFTARVSMPKALGIAKAWGVEISDADSAEETAKALREYILGMMHTCHLKSLKEQGVTREQAVACAPGAIAHNGFFYNTLAPISQEEMGELMGRMYDLYQ